MARREHARKELAEKLSLKGFLAEDVDAVLTALEAKNLLSESRYVDSFVRASVNKGHGPVKIQFALKQQEILEAQLQASEEWGKVDWEALAKGVRQKRFGAAPPKDLADKQKQTQFLLRRGFLASHMQKAFVVEA